jgi:hypothetical protein
MLMREVSCFCPSLCVWILKFEASGRLHEGDCSCVARSSSAPRTVPLETRRGWVQAREHNTCMLQQGTTEGQDAQQDKSPSCFTRVPMGRGIHTHRTGIEFMRHQSSCPRTAFPSVLYSSLYSRASWAYGVCSLYKPRIHRIEMSACMPIASSTRACTAQALMMPPASCLYLHNACMHGYCCIGP